MGRGRMVLRTAHRTLRKHSRSLGKLMSPSPSNPLIAWWRSPQAVMTVGSFLLLLGTILVSLWNNTQELSARVVALEQSAKDRDVQDVRVAENLRHKLDIVDQLDKESSADRRSLVSRIIALEVSHERANDRLSRLELVLFTTPPPVPPSSINRNKERPAAQQREFGG